jgi:RNA ligase (TIGR02306 family)
MREIQEILVHENADSLEIAVVDGWNCVVGKGQYQAGEKVLYCEIDTVLPVHEDFEFLRKTSYVEKEWVTGFRLKTIRLRGEYSQGLLLPLSCLASRGVSEPEFDTDYSEVLGAVKWDPPLNACIAGEAKGLFPSRIPKTEEERIQNCKRQFHRWSKFEEEREREWEVTEKLDGSSMTVYIKVEEGVQIFGVASRNLDLRETESNSLWGVAREYDLETKMRNLGRELAIQGEICGPGIQKNPYKLLKADFFVYKIYDIKECRYLDSKERVDLVRHLGLKHVPILAKELLHGKEMTEIILGADGNSVLCSSAKREGLVYKSGQESFKAISNKWLLKNE